MNISTGKIEESIVRILASVKEMCDHREFGLTNFAYRHIGEVFGLPNGCKVHVLPGFEESIMVVRGASLIALQRSHAEPVRENMKWKMTIRRNPTSAPIPSTKHFTISDDVLAKLPAIVQTLGNDRVQLAATDLMNSYCNFRGAWKKTRESVAAALLVARDLEGILPLESHDFAQEREPVREQSPEIPRTLDI